MDGEHAHQETQDGRGDDALMRVIPRVQLAGLALACMLLFVSVVTSPLKPPVLDGLLGATGVWLWAAVAAVMALQRCALLGTRFYAKATGRVHEPAATRARCARLIILLLFLALAVVLAEGVRAPYGVGLVTGHDQPQYFAYLHSWVFDRDLDFGNEYAAMPGVAEMMAEHHPENPGHNVAPVGAPLLWLPFYLAAHAALLALGALGVDAATDGLSAPYAMAAAFGSLALAWLGATLAFRTLRTWFSVRTAACAVLLVCLASPLPWYLLIEPWMSHACSFFAAAWALYAWNRLRETNRTRDALVLGLAIAAAMLVRPSHAVLLILPILVLVEAAKREGGRQALVHLAVCTGAAIAGFAPQLLTWGLVSGLSAPPGSPMALGQPALISILFSSHHGLFAWHPALMLGFVGLPLLWRKSRWACVSISAAIVLTWYLNAAIASWWGGSTFGMRRFVGVLPFLAVGAAAGGSWLVAMARKRPLAPVALLMALFVIYNGLLMRQVRYALVSASDPVSFRKVWGQSAMLFHDRFGTPASYPVNLWFAWRHGVSPSQYDLLSGAASEAGGFAAAKDGLRPYLGGGWDTSSPAALSTQIGFEAIAQEAKLLVPLRRGQGYQVTLGLALPRGFSGPQPVEVLLGGRIIGQGTVVPKQVTALSLSLEKEAARNGVNELVLRFGRVEPGKPYRPPYGMEAPGRKPVTRAALLTELTVAPARQ